MGDTLKLLKEGDLIEWLQEPNVGVRSRIVIHGRRYFSVNVDGAPTEMPVELEDEGRVWARLRSRTR